MRHGDEINVTSYLCATSGGRDSQHSSSFPVYLYIFSFSSGSSFFSFPFTSSYSVNILSNHSQSDENKASSSLPSLLPPFPISFLLFSVSSSSSSFSFFSLLFLLRHVQAMRRMHAEEVSEEGEVEGDLQRPKALTPPESGRVQRDGAGGSWRRRSRWRRGYGGGGRESRGKG